jgi:hypothetical protein
MLEFINHDNLSSLQRSGMAWHSHNRFGSRTHWTDSEQVSENIR